MTLAGVTPAEVLAGNPDRSRPWVTHYAGPDSRVELSVASVANAVAKAAGLLRDGLGLAPGAAVVSVDLPLHWQLPVWVLSALSVGATCGRRLSSRDHGVVDVRVVGPEGLRAVAGGADPGADMLLISACDTFGLPLSGDLQAAATALLRAGAALDIGVEVRAYPDRFDPEQSAGPAGLLVDAESGQLWPWAQAATAGAEGLAPGARLWVDERTAGSQVLLRTALVPLVTAGSVVIARGLSEADERRIRAAERVPEGS